MLFNPLRVQLILEGLVRAEDYGFVVPFPEAQDRALAPSRDFLKDCLLYTSDAADDISAV